MRNVRNNAGFTLIELMIVVVIIGILAAIAIPKFSSFSDDAREKEGQSTLKQLHTLQEMYFTTFGKYTGTLGDLTQFGYDAASTTAMKHYNVATTGTDKAQLCMQATPKVTGTALRAFSIDEVGVLRESAEGATTAPTC